MSPPVGALSGSGIVQPVGSSSATDTESTVYFHGEKNLTWRHWRIEAPTLLPASSTRGVSPRASRWAAAAKPTGPAPMTATGSAFKLDESGALVDEGVDTMRNPWIAGRLAAGKAVEQPLQSGDDGLFVESVVHLATVFADTNEASAAQDVQVMRNRRAAERDALGDLADVQLSARQDLHQILAHRIGERGEEIATDSQMLAQGAHLWIERVWIDQAALVLIGYCANALKHVNILV